jgi:hypothetical protein
MEMIKLYNFEIYDKVEIKTLTISSKIVFIIISDDDLRAVFTNNDYNIKIP